MSTVNSAPTIICVLGMSRTGTSLTTRVLSLAGVYLGPEEELLQKELRQLDGEGEAVLARARDTNPEGFWEHYRIMRLNERILRRLGGNWREPPQMPPGWESSDELAAERDEARALLEESFGGHELWGWKDPRNSLTLPFWQRLLPEMRYVICLRNPVDVAASASSAIGMKPAVAHALWSQYLAAALVNTSGRRRIFAPYEEYFDSWPQPVELLAQFVDRSPSGDSKQRIEETIADRMRHHHSAPRDVVFDDVVPVGTTSLYLLTELLAAASNGVFGGRDGLQEAIDLYAAKLLAASNGCPDEHRQ